ncbi:unnamed protein product [Adineta steineri]|uniref:Uncharacterized protein n=2 Tax=Adineta steineri TaxID=433720 RepID=A0A818WDY5_9BILA|nr:unnamed protein product [Adineta steineri]CAF1273808.1 unnamed protein product [Adineta steineri]CAF3723766.1 unnamed protein product [Adineta steineri]
MSYMFIESFQSQAALSSSKKQLSCGGHPCKRCGACRDWYLRPNSDDFVKHNNASCNCDYMYCHNLVRHRIRYRNEFYPIHSLICMCKDNCWK